MSSARLIWSRRDMGILRKRKHRTAYRLLGGMPDRVFAVSELVRRHCIDVDRIAPNRVDTIYNGLELADWSPATTPGETPNDCLITSVGNIRQVKGQDIFIRAAAQVVQRFPEVRFSIAGSVLEPAYFRRLEELIREFGLADRFHFAGGVRDLRSHFAAAQMFVLPSRSEGFSNAIVEAMAMTLPVVATDVGGNAEAVSDGVSGIIVPGEDPDALAAAMLRLLEDPAGARKMGEAGRQIVAGKFTTASMMTRITRIYAELLSPGASPRVLSKRMPRAASREESASST
jgi:glycosyltransferase involved in cell wall biosynthesis